MNNNQNINFASDINTKIRPKRVYLTSDNVSDFTSSSRTTYILKENIIAEEGFNLAFGIGSLGLKASAYNISSYQNNNKLLITYSYKLPIWIPVKEDDHYTYTKNPTVWNTALSDLKPDEQIASESHIITLPDAYYPSLSAIFDYLNRQINVFIPSRVKRDINRDLVTSPEKFNDLNDVPISLIFNETDFGFRISVRMGVQDNEKNYFADIINFYEHYEADVETPKGLEAYFVNNRPVSIEIKPAPGSSLYELLFKNLSSTLHKSPGCPSFVNESTLHNPPTSIYFSLVNKFGTTTEPNATNPFVLQTNNEPTISDPDETLNFQGFFLPDTDLADKIYNASSKTILSNYVNYPLTIYCKPALNPIYININTDLETHNFTDDGTSSNTLIKQFVPGNTIGVTDFYEKWENPIWHSTLRQNINSISLSFESEGNKWEFFNLNFVLELILFEYPEGNEISQYLDQVFDVPSADPTTTYLNQYLGSMNNPHTVMTEPNFTPLLTNRLKRKKN